MNDGQNSKYWRRWAFVCRHNHCRWLKGRLADNAAKAASHHHLAIWRLAETLSDQACRAVEADDLRHACHVYAFDRDVSHSAMTNAQFDRLLLLWGNERDVPGLLVDPDHVTAQIAWDNPNIARKNSLIRSIKEAADDEYICSITLDVWGTEHWENLDMAALLGLLRKIKGNAPARPGQPF